MLGLDGTEQIIKSRYKTYCSLCSRLIEKDEEIYGWKGNKFVIHLDCNSAEVKQRMTNTEFRKNVKKKKKRVSVK